MVKAYNIAIICLVGIIIVAFFLPWVKVESEAVGTFSKILTGKQQSAISNISAYQVPIMANDQDARLMISIIKIFNPKVENADKKSYLIWSIPALAALILLVSLLYGRNKWVNLIFGAIGCLIFFAAVYKIKTTNMDKLVLKVTTEPGLWLTLWAYLGIGIVGLASFIKASLKKS